MNERLLNLLYSPKNRLAYRKRPAIEVLMLEQIELEKLFPKAKSAFHREDRGNKRLHKSRKALQNQCNDILGFAKVLDSQLE